MNTDMYTVVEISFDKMVGVLFIDSMSSVTQEAPPWLASDGEIFKVCPVQIV